MPNFNFLACLCLEVAEKFMGGGVGGGGTRGYYVQPQPKLSRVALS